MESLMKWMKCDNAHEIIKKTRAQVIYSTIALYLVVACGTVIGWSAPMLPRLEVESDTIKALIVSGVFIGMLLAAVPAFFLVDIMGRKNTMILAAIILVVYWFLVAIGLDVLIVARVVGGFGVGVALYSTRVYVGEITHESVRMYLGVVSHIMLYLGIVYEFLIAPFTPIILLSILSAMLPLSFIFLVCVTQMPDTPYYYFKKGKRSRAIESLKKLKMTKKTKLIRGERIMIESYFVVDREGRAFDRLFKTGRNRKMFLVLLGLMFFQQFSGFLVIICYLTEILERHQIGSSANISTIIYGLLLIAFTIFWARFIDRTERTSFLLASSVGCVIPLTVYSVLWYGRVEEHANYWGLSWLDHFCLVLFLFMFMAGLGPLPSMIVADMLSNDVSEAASLLLTIANRLFSVLVVLGYGMASSGIEPYITFSVFAVCCLLCAVYVYFFVPEFDERIVITVK